MRYIYQNQQTSPKYIVIARCDKVIIIIEIYILYSAFYVVFISISTTSHKFLLPDCSLAVHHRRLSFVQHPCSSLSGSLLLSTFGYIQTSLLVFLFMQQSFSYGAQFNPIDEKKYSLPKYADNDIQINTLHKQNKINASFFVKHISH